MATKPPPTVINKPTLQKPPGYRDPGVPPVKPRQPPLRRPTQLPPSFRHAGKRKTRYITRRTIFCWLLFALVSFILLLAIFTALSYLYFQPRFPSFHLQSLNATRIHISTTDNLDTSVLAKILTWNPNSKIGIVYGDGIGHITAEDQDGDVELGEAEVKGFYLQEKKAGVMEVNGVENGVVLDEAVTARVKEGYRKGRLRVKVEMEIKMGVRVKGKDTWKIPVKVECSPVRLKETGKKGRGAGLGGMAKCQVYLFKWFNIN
ncbi:hypothetical protein LUZ60_012547 [Juncus effusus]|nr:hypothetical protein LUZ60_012547 [Juncus effusus]